MTRKDYVLIAEACSIASDERWNEQQRMGAVLIVERLAELFGRGDPRFDRIVFLRACGLPA